MRLVLIDAMNSMYRAFFALPPLRSSAGEPTNAVLGFTNMLNKVIREEQPDHLVIVFDARGKSFRHERFPEYKAGRDAQPEDLSVQFPLVRKVIAAYNLPTLEIPGVEADDVIATLVRAAPGDAEVRVVSTDKDLMQLVDDKVTLLDGMKDRRFGPAEVEERMGVPPEKVLDTRALVGDPSDNIPGVKGIGAKGAAKLILEFGDLENLLDNAAQVKAKRAREALLENAEVARLSKDLAMLKTDVELPCGFDEFEIGAPDQAVLRELFTELGFTRLLDSLDAAGDAPTETAVPAPSEVEVVRGAKALAELAENSPAEPRALVLIEASRPDPATTPRPFAIAVAEGDRVALAILAEDDADERDALDRLFAAPWLARETDRMQRVLGDFGVEAGSPAFDVEIAAFLLDPSAQRTTAALGQAMLGRNVRAFTDVAGRGAKASPVESILTPELAAWAGEEAIAIGELAPILRERLDADGLLPLLEDIELPLAGVLARMERAGVRVNEAFLGELSVEYEKDLARIEGEIYALAGEEFLVSSPKQLQRILFEKLELPAGKKTKTGFSTDESVLERLSTQHELPAKILAHRRLAKLKSTYVDALPRLVNPETGRIHPSFHQTGAATGRLSCTEPNLQNIPIRTQEGVRIREAFVPSEGKVLASADYSQVELRILAHFSEDESLIDAFESGEDVHRRTAAEVAGIDPAEVTSDQRARAKAINFGIIYGSTAFGIANQLGIPSSEAQATIDTYFDRYRGVRRFLDETVANAREAGFVTTLFQRRRYLPDLNSRNRVLRQAAERVAVNSVIQGTAADLIKKAMIEVDETLAAEAPGARMIVQVHDELVLELPAADAEALGQRVRGIMEGVHSLRVPLDVDVGTGASWREAH
jgi:DNA polymerase-1